MITGALGQIAIGDRIGETGIETVLFAIPGALLGLAVDLRDRRCARSRARPSPPEPAPDVA